MTNEQAEKVRTLIKHAKMGCPKAMYDLGIMHQRGFLGEVDLNTAAEWIGAAADPGCKPAKDWMDDYCFDDNAAVQAHS